MKVSEHGLFYFGQLFPISIICCIVGLFESIVFLPFWAIFLFASGIILCKLSYKSEIKNLCRLFAWAMLVRVISILFLYYWFIYWNGDPFWGGGDDWDYEMRGYFYYRHWSCGSFYFPECNHPAYPFMMGCFHYLGEIFGGYNTLIPRMFNAFIGALMAPFGYILAKNIFNKRIAKIAGIMIALFPFFLFYSSVQLRDIIIAFLFLFSLAKLSQFIHKGGLPNIILAFAASLPMFFFRTGFGFLQVGIVGICLCCCMAFQQGKTTKQFGRKLALLIIAVIICGGGAVFMMRGNSQLSEPLEEGYVSERLASQREHYGAGAGSNSIAGKINRKLPFALGLLVRPPLAYIMPYPFWSAFKAPPHMIIINLINGFIWAVLMPFGIIGIKNAGWKKHFPKNLMVLIPLVLILTASSAGSFQTRYKLASIAFSLIFCAVGWDIVVNQKSKIDKAYYWCIQFGLVFVYMAAKLIF